MDLVFNASLGEFNTDNVVPNKSYFITGEQSRKKETLIRGLCFYLKDSLAILKVFCPENKNAFYRTIIPDAFITNDFSIEGVAEVIKRQKENIDFCDSVGQDPNSREALKSQFNLLLIIDRSLYTNNKKDPWLQDADFQNSLIETDALHITTLYIVLESKWALPQTVMNSSMIYMCFITSFGSVANSINAKKYFGSHLTGLKEDRYAKLLSKLDHQTECAVLIRGINSHEAGWSGFLQKFVLPSSFPALRLGTDAQWSYVVPEKRETENEKKRFNEEVLGLLNMVDDDKKILISIV